MGVIGRMDGWMDGRGLKGRQGEETRKGGGSGVEPTSSSSLVCVGSWKGTNWTKERSTGSQKIRDYTREEEMNHEN